MSETKFTPGPWEARNEAYEHPTINNMWHVGCPSAGPHHTLARVFSLHKHSDETFANAHLIAAAPELYEALEELLASDQAYDFSRSKAAETSAYAALKKARGEA